jgi:hypothetical protein
MFCMILYMIFSMLFVICLFMLLAITFGRLSKSNRLFWSYWFLGWHYMFFEQ